MSTPAAGSGARPAVPEPALRPWQRRGFTRRKRLHQPLVQTLRKRHRNHPLQRCSNAPELTVQRTGSRIGLQPVVKLGERSNIEFGIDLGVDQFECALVGHHSCPRAASTSRKACRAVYSRDFTVLTGHSRICAISS